MMHPVNALHVVPEKLLRSPRHPSSLNPGRKSLTTPDFIISCALLYLQGLFDGCAVFVILVLDRQAPNIQEITDVCDNINLGNVSTKSGTPSRLGSHIPQNFHKPPLRVPDT